MTDSVASLLAQEKAISCYAASISVASVLTFPVLVYVIRTHLISQGRGFSVKTLFSPFNAALLGLSMSFTGLCAANSYALSTGFDPQIRANCGTIQAVFIHIPKLERVMKFLLHAIPCIFYASLAPQLAAAVLAATQPRTSIDLLNFLGNLARGVNAAGSISTIVFDIVLLIAFAKSNKYFRQTSGLKIDEKRLLIISTYGAWAITVYFISTAFFVASFSIQPGVTSDEIMLVAQTLLLIVYLILLAMKVALQRQVGKGSSVCPPGSALKVVPSVVERRVVKFSQSDNAETHHQMV
ncbi:hypothetical protein BC830DRAFT_1222531 [Chytriomyces sp. MP71]|nr:hypothetical protein BC830DRAFT_1222531 [Chytriomyces sp. MP71]